jgi:hypothetical protein
MKVISCVKGKVLWKMCAMETAKSQTYVVNEIDKCLNFKRMFRDVVVRRLAVRRAQGLSFTGEVCSLFAHDNVYIGTQFKLLHRWLPQTCACERDGVGLYT